MNYRRIFVENSLLFLTLVTNDRKNLLIDNIEFLKQALYNVKKKFIVLKLLHI